MANNNHKHALLILIVFISILWGGDKLLSLMLQEVLSFSEDRFIKLYESKYSESAVIIGNSRADRHFPAPQLSPIIGMPVVNLGLGRESMVLSEVLFRDYVEHNGLPRLLIIEPTNMVTDPTIVGGMRLFGIYSERINRLTRELNPEYFYTTRLFNLFYFNNEMFFRVLMGVIRPEKDRRHHGIIPDRLITELRKKEAKGVMHHKENEMAIIRILEFAASNDIDVRLIATPYLSLNNVDQHDYMKDWLDWLQNRIGNNYRVFNYTRAIKRKENFRDTVHLNAKGVGELNKLFVNDNVFKNIN